MKKKMLICSIFVIFMLMMLPSISAFKVENKIVEKTGPYIPEKFPLLYIFVASVSYSYALRAILWSCFCFEGWGGLGPTPIYNENSFAYKRSVVLAHRMLNWNELWENFAEKHWYSY